MVWRSSGFEKQKSVEPHPLPGISNGELLHLEIQEACTASNELHHVSKPADKFPLFFPAVHTSKYEEVSPSAPKEKLYIQTLAQ